jgi:hypothetical protein
MRQAHVGGDKLFVDYAGDTVPLRLASVEPTAKQNVGPNNEPAIGLVSDLGLRGMIEAWFELERMKSNLVPGPDIARMLKRCEVRIRGAIMHLASETVTESMAAADRSGGLGDFARVPRLTWQSCALFV